MESRFSKQRYYEICINLLGEEAKEYVRYNKHLLYKKQTNKSLF